LQGGLLVETGMRGVVVLAFDPAPQFTVERLEAGGIVRAQAGQQLGSYGFEPALDFSLSLGPVRAGGQINVMPSLAQTSARC
jgi:hypothetical protein